MVRVMSMALEYLFHPGGVRRYDDFTGTYAYDFQNLLLPYLPYFSNCREYDSYIPFYALTESDQCQLPTIDEG
jgi:hypothetical protein